MSMTARVDHLSLLCSCPQRPAVALIQVTLHSITIHLASIVTVVVLQPHSSISDDKQGGRYTVAALTFTITIGQPIPAQHPHRSQKRVGDFRFSRQRLASLHEESINARKCREFQPPVHAKSSRKVCRFCQGRGRCACRGKRERSLGHYIYSEPPYEGLSLHITETMPFCRVRLPSTKIVIRNQAEGKHSRSVLR